MEGSSGKTSGLAHPGRRVPGDGKVHRFSASHSVLLFAFAFAVMADPVSSVAYAIEAALRALGGDLALLMVTMTLVVAIICLIIVNYQRLVARYPMGGDAAAAAGEAFGEGWAFLPIGALIVDFVLTIAISVSAGTSAIIDYAPELSGWRIPLAVGLILLVASITWFGNLGRAVFAVLTVVFIVFAVLVIIGAFTTPVNTADTVAQAPHAPALSVALAFPVAMALATGVEAPSSAIAQLGQLDDHGRRQFGRITLWLTLGIVGGLTIGLTAATVHLGGHIPDTGSTLIADIAKASVPTPVYGLFQGATALLLLSAASSSFQAGPGLLKALARRTDGAGHELGILPRPLGRTNSHYTPYSGVVVFAIMAVAVTITGGAQDQRLVLYYAVAVFISFLMGLLAMARFSHQDAETGWLVVNMFGAAVVGFTLVVNLARGRPLVSLAASLLLAAALYITWVRQGRPRGIAHAASDAHQVQSEPSHQDHTQVEVRQASPKIPPATLDTPSTSAQVAPPERRHARRDQHTRDEK
ncbi:APC family permease [Rhodococcus marinonascens]|uniref:APC family permease n=1 Tax=Rhodococcus marinonascens TaxID=38311 RepID=UPI000934DC57|nr:APC family permease [Rhodococcus marinonascens]